MFVSATLTPSLKKFIIDRFEEESLNFLIASKTHYNLANLEHNFIPSSGQNKLTLLNDTLKSIFGGKHDKYVVIFCNSIKCVRALDFFLKKMEFKCNSLHGEMPISIRSEVHNNFKNKRVNILISTDLASRGLNFEFVDYVINFDFPHSTNDYLHRYLPFNI
jgi:superfamily II DNA/RNA helicase